MKKPTTIADLIPLKKNPNRGSKRGNDLLLTSFEQAGAGRSIVVAANNEVLAGNHALEAYGQTVDNPDLILVESDGTKLVVVKRTDIPNAKDKKGQHIVIADNKTSDHHEYDVEVLTGYDAEVLSEYWFEEELQALDGYEAPSPLEDTPPDVSRADELQVKWQVERGQVWQVGKHRVMCGDSTSAEDAATLFAGKKARLLVTDPPYGVDFKGAKYNPRAKEWDAIANDTRQGDNLREWLGGVLTSWCSYIEDDSAFYLWSAIMQEGMAALMAAEDAGIHIQSQIMWVKNTLVLGQADYQWSHENCWYGFIKGKKHRWYGGRSQRTVWEIDKVANQSYLHPMQKPIECYSIPMQNHTSEGDICADPFVGSGTQIVAAEQLGRVCYGMELHPPYVAVCLERLSKLGLTPQLMDS